MMATVAERLAFTVPPALEAQEPPEFRSIPRDHVQMLVSERASGNVVHTMFVDIAAFLRPGDVLVVNDSATLPAALDGRRWSGEPLTVHLSSPVAGTLWIVEPRGAVGAGESVALPARGSATFLAPVSERSQRLWYARVAVPEPIDEYLAAEGRAIRYGYVGRDIPIEAYQTMFARVPGSAEMPSAARPFTQRVLDGLLARGVEIVTVTLHCGVSSAESHEPPQPERFDVGVRAAARLNGARAEGRRVIAVGTSVVRAVESSVRDREVVASQGWTDLVVTGERGVFAVNGLLTGLHEPRSSHLAMLEAFLPASDLLAAYAAALDHRYLWHEFGDVHFIL
jgi:S-adenosylmethionine:tRNA ribosyltransferase-isomerase